MSSQKTLIKIKFPSFFLTLNKLTKRRTACMEDFSNLFTTLRYKDLSLLLSGKHPETRAGWLKCKWVKYSSGFKINCKARLSSKTNPRKSGQWPFDECQKLDQYAIEYLQCNGNSGCDHTAEINGKCAVKIKLVYKQGKQCEVYSNSVKPYHGKNFVPTQFLSDRDKIKIDKQTSINRGTKPTQMHKYLIKNGCTGTKTQISNYIYYKNNKNFTANYWNDLYTYTTRFKNFIYPSKSSEIKNKIVIIKFNKKCLNFVTRKMSEEDSIVGLDAQFKNNKERIPLFILCAQTKEFVTVPGFIIITESVGQLGEALAILKNWLSVKGIVWKCWVMIDKDSSERAALFSNSLKFLLCEFHIMKALEPRIAKIPKKLRCQAIFYFKKVQRSSTKIELNGNIRQMKQWCEKNNLD